MAYGFQQGFLSQMQVPSMFGHGGGCPQQDRRRQTQPRGAADGDWYCPGCADRQFGKNSQCRNCGTPKEQGVNDISEIPNVIDKFLSGKEIEPGVEEQLRNLGPDLQKVVMERGSLFSARDPSAVLRQRMNEINCPRRGDWYCPTCNDLQFAKNDSCRGCGRDRTDADLIEGGTPQLPDAETFLQPFEIDENKRDQFMRMESDKQAAVIAKGTLKGARDPTAVLVKRMRQVMDDGRGRGDMGMSFGRGDFGGMSQGMSSQGQGNGPREGDWYCSKCHDLQFARNSECRRCGSARSDVDTGGVPDLPTPQEFLSSFDIDEDKKNQFYNMAPEVQEAIMAKGTLHGARDVTAVLVSRMNQVLTSQGGFSANDPSGPRPGDWYCNKCHDLQFAKNDKCRSCGGSRSEVDNGGAPQLPDPEEFVSAFDIEEDKKRQFLDMSRKMQMAIVAKGTLAGARDPTAVLIARMNTVLKESKGMGKGGGYGKAMGKDMMGFGMDMMGPYGCGGFGKGKGGGDGPMPDWAWAAFEKGFQQAAAKGGKACGKSCGGGDFGMAYGKGGGCDFGKGGGCNFGKGDFGKGGGGMCGGYGGGQW